MSEWASFCASQCTGADSESDRNSNRSKLLTLSSAHCAFNLVTAHVDEAPSDYEQRFLSMA